MTEVIKSYFRKISDSLIEIDSYEIYSETNFYSYDVLAFPLENLDKIV